LRTRFGTCRSVMPSQNHRPPALSRGRPVPYRGHGRVFSPALPQCRRVTGCSGTVLVATRLGPTGDATSQMVPFTVRVAGIDFPDHHQPTARARRLQPAIAGVHAIECGGVWLRVFHRGQPRAPFARSVRKMRSRISRKWGDSLNTTIRSGGPPPAILACGRVATSSIAGSRPIRIFKVSPPCRLQYQALPGGGAASGLHCRSRQTRRLCKTQHKRRKSSRRNRVRAGNGVLQAVRLTEGAGARQTAPFSRWRAARAASGSRVPDVEEFVVGRGGNVALLLARSAVEGGAHILFRIAQLRQRDL
jgi:hypothetical protein